MFFTSVEFRRAMAHFATGITVVTTSLENRWDGLTVNAFCSIFLNPALILVSLDKTTSTYPVLAQSRIFWRKHSAQAAAIPFRAFRAQR